MFLRVYDRSYEVFNSMGGVMVSMLNLSAVDYRFWFWLGQNRL